MSVTKLQAVSYFQMQVNQLQNTAMQKSLSSGANDADDLFEQIKGYIQTAIDAVDGITLSELAGCGGGRPCGSYEHCDGEDCVFGPPRPGEGAGPLN